LKNQKDKFYSIIDIFIENQKYELMDQVIKIAIRSDKTGLVYNGLTRYLQNMSKDSATKFLESKSFLF